MAALTPVDPAARLEVLGGLNRPPMPESAAAELFALAQKVGRRSGLPEPVGVSVGGGSDGNFTAALGIPTLDGLGVTGGGAHADHEHAETADDGRPRPPPGRARHRPPVAADPRLPARSVVPGRRTKPRCTKTSGQGSGWARGRVGSSSSMPPWPSVPAAR